MAASSWTMTVAENRRMHSSRTRVPRKSLNLEGILLVDLCARLGKLRRRDSVRLTSSTRTDFTFSSFITFLHLLLSFSIHVELLLTMHCVVDTAVIIPKVLALFLSDFRCSPARLITASSSRPYPGSDAPGPGCCSGYACHNSLKNSGRPFAATCSHVRIRVHACLAFALQAHARGRTSLFTSEGRVAVPIWL